MTIKKERKQPPLWVFIIAFFIVFALISIGLTLLFKLPWVLPIPFPWGLLIGLVLLGFGFFILISALQALTIRRAFGKEIYKTKTESQLITTGIYAHTRNPLYLGVILLLFGWAFVFLFTFLLIMSGLFIILFVLVAKWEEKELTERFGDEYHKYRNQVPFFIPS
jgi:protein-S-isoprenylcysteine O-methyltransferase Ste14